MPDQQSPKQEVGYSFGLPGKTCSLCQTFISPDKCRRVAGTIQAYGWCNLFQPDPAKPAPWTGGPPGTRSTGAP